MMAILKNINARQARRFYLFVLLSSVIFLALLCLFPQRSSSMKKIARIDVALKHADNPTVVKQIVIETIKKQLSEDYLSRTLQSIAATTELKSKILGIEDINRVRNELMGGALSLDAQSSESIEGQTTSPDLAFSVALRGHGTEDEVAFIKSLADEIRLALAPESLGETALLKLSEIQSQLRESEALNRDFRESLEGSLEKYLSSQRQMFTKSGFEPGSTTKAPSPAATTSQNTSSNWELKNLTEQRKKAYKEFLANKDIQFDAKESVQQSLIRRIEYLDQEINRLQNAGQGDRVADKKFGVEKASFVDVQTGFSSTEADKPLQNLKTEVALVINKLDLARNSHKRTQMATTQLSQLLQQEKTDVSISAPSINDVDPAGLTSLWLMLAMSGIVSGLIVIRIDSRAFASMLQNGDEVERALQLPVIGQVAIPESDGAGNRLRALNRLVSRTIRSCEWVLLVVFFIFLFVLFVNSSFSILWLNDPIQVLKTSFS